MDLIPNADGRFAMDAFYGVMPPSDELQELIAVSEMAFRGLEPWLNAQYFTFSLRPKPRVDTFSDVIIPEGKN